MQPLNIDPQALNGVPPQNREYLAILMRYGFDAFFVSASAAIGSPLAQRIVQALMALEEARAGGSNPETLKMAEELKSITSSHQALLQENQQLKNELALERTLVKSQKEAPQSFSPAGVAQTKASSTGSSKPSSPSSKPSVEGQITKEFLIEKYGIKVPDFSSLTGEKLLSAKKELKRLLDNASSREHKLRKRLANGNPPTKSPVKQAPKQAPKPSPSVNANERSSEESEKPDTVASLASRAIADAENSKNQGIASIAQEIPVQGHEVPFPPANAPLEAPPAMSLPSGLQLPDFLRQSQAVTNNLQPSLPPMPQPVGMGMNQMFPGQYPAAPAVRPEVAEALDGLLD